MLALLCLPFCARAQYAPNLYRAGPSEPVIACAGTPGNTIGNWAQQCQDVNNVVYACTITTGTGCVLAAHWNKIGGASGAGTVTSVGLAGTANQVTVTGATPITGSGSWTLSLPSSAILPGTPSEATKPASGDNSLSLATTNWVTQALAALNPATSVAAATVTVLPNSPTYSAGVLTAGSHAALVIDGYTVLLNDRVLINNQASALQNGVYTETTLGTAGVSYVLTRATDFNTAAAINLAGVVPVINGTVNNNSTWALDVSLATLGTSPVNYDQTNAQVAVPPPHAITFSLSPTATGDQKRYPSFHYACTIKGWDITSDLSGSISVDIWKANAAIPTSGGKISASAPVALSSAQLAQGGSIAGWTTAVTANDVFGANVTSYATLTNVTLTIWCQ